MKAWSKTAATAACLGYALITATLFGASPWIRPVLSTGIFLAALSAAAFWACARLPVRGWLRRYRELGGEFVTLGSDAHQVRRFGENLDLAKVRAKQAGIRYIATYTAMQPELHPIDN